MAKPQKEKASDKIEFRSDGWKRFEKAVDAAVKSGPKRRPKPKGRAPRK